MDLFGSYTAWQHFEADSLLRQWLRPKDYWRAMGDVSAWWYEIPVDGVPETDDMRREARLIGLLLLAEMARTGDMP